MVGACLIMIGGRSIDAPRLSLERRGVVLGP